MKTFIVLFVAFGTYTTVSAICGSVICAGDEYCNSNITNCQCNSTLYSNTGSDPAPTVDCSAGKLNINVLKCWLEKNDYNTSNIHLQSASCVAAREIVNNTAQMTFHRPLISNDCNNTVTVNTTHVTYGNTLYIFSNKFPVITRNDVQLNVSCSFPLSLNVQLNVTLKPIVGTTVINVPGSTGSLAVSMAAYKDSTFLTLLSQNDQINVEDSIYISVLVPGLDVNSFKVKVLRIYATPAGADTPEYDLLVNGCPASGETANLMTVNSNGIGAESRFTMKVFQISGFTSVMLYAEVTLCSTNCNTSCSAVSRSVDTPDNTATVSLYLEANDPVDYSSANGFSMPWTLTTLMSSWMLVKLI